MAKSKNTKEERARRKMQSQKDKKGRTTVMVQMPAKSKKKTKGLKTGSDSYARLVLDPCHGPFTQSNMPGIGGGQAIRMPFRLKVTVPSATSNITGGAITGGAVSDTLTAILTPHAMVPGVGPFSLSVVSTSNESQVLGGPPAAGYFVAQDPVGLTALASMAGEARPIAACVRISCLGSDTVNSGLFFGYEGPARQIIQHSGDDTTQYYPQISAQQLILTGGITNPNTYGILEAKVNYPNASPDWQTFRQLTGSASSATGVLSSGDAADPDWSQMPIAVAGVTSATPGAQYLIDGAIVYEWQPKLALGIDTPARKPVGPTALQSTARTIQSVAQSWGGMLVHMAADYATGGSASAINGILRTAFAASSSKQSAGHPMLGWK